MNAEKKPAVVRKRMSEKDYEIKYIPLALVVIKCVYESRGNI